jgi:hypothetical protein
MSKSGNKVQVLMCREIAERAEGGEHWDLVGVRLSFVAGINSHRRQRHF